MENILAFIKQLKQTKKWDSSRSHILQSLYYSVLEFVLLNKYEAAAEALNLLRHDDFSQDEEVEAVRRFITARLSMKRGDAGEDLSWIDLPLKKDSWLMAEKLHVEGHWKFHLGSYDEGSDCFYLSEKIFHTLSMFGREFVSCFNGIMGEVMGQKKLSALVQLDKLRALELKVLPHREKQDCARVLAMVYRQKAHAFEDLNRPHASLEEISKAIVIFELNGPVSDYQLALLHASDISCDLGDHFRSKTCIDYIIPPVDTRVEFPLAMVKWRLGGPVPDKSNFAILPTGWVEKFDKLLSESQANEAPEWIWDLKMGKLTGPEGESVEIKAGSLEGRLLKFLSQEKATRVFLVEMLWPLQGKTELLDNRLHRLISRLNKKLNESIVFDGKYYVFTARLRVI